MTTTLLNTVRKIQWFCQQGDDFCMHVFSSRSVICTNNKRVGSSNYLIVRCARKPCFHIWQKRVPNFFIWHKCVPKIFYRSRYHAISFLLLGTIWTGLVVRTEPRQLIGLASDNAHSNPTLLLLVKITNVIFRVNR